MYKIIGGDQKQYGPVSKEQMEQWIAQGRANVQTQVQAEGAGDWRPLSAFPEFARALGLKGQAAPAPPPIGAGKAGLLAQEILARDYHVDIGRCFSRGWQLVKNRFGLLAGASAIILLISLGLESIPGIGWIAGTVLMFVLWGGLDWMFLKAIRGQPVELGVAFSGFSLAFVPLMLGGIVSQLLTLLGLLLLILPGVYLFVAWWVFTPLLIMDKQLEFWPAMELSRKVVNRHWFQVFGLALISMLVTMAGMIALIIGVFVTVPIAVGATVYAYEDIFNPRTEVVSLPPATGPSQAPPA